jgi:hypothetical protein
LGEVSLFRSGPTRRNRLESRFLALAQGQNSPSSIILTVALAIRGNHSSHPCVSELVSEFHYRNQFQNGEPTVNKKFAICSALLVLSSIAVVAQDSKSGIIHINGGATTVAIRPSAQQPNAKGIEPPANPFYDNIGTSGYQQYVGYAVCDGISSCGAEWTPANQITSLKTGTTKKISLGLGFVKGTNRSLVILTRDCKNKPCVNPDGAPQANRLCQGTVKNMPIFSDSNTQVVSFNCAAQLTKGNKYWVLIVAPPDADLAWNFSVSARAGIVLGDNDRWGTYQSQQPVGALTIQ